jgi:transposase InsO family protein
LSEVVNALGRRCDPSIRSSIEEARSDSAGSGVLRTYVEHYNRERPHRALNLRPPQARSGSEPTACRPIHRRDRLGGLIHEYYEAAA